MYQNFLTPTSLLNIGKPKNTQYKFSHFVNIQTASSGHRILNSFYYTSYLKFDLTIWWICEIKPEFIRLTSYVNGTFNIDLKIH